MGVGVGGELFGEVVLERGDLGVQDSQERHVGAGSLVVEGRERRLPVGLDLAVYRIVQEALTNVRRHAAASHVHVLLRYGDGDVQIEVRDDGMGATPSGASGHGLIGMRERAALYGGRLETDSAAGKGFTVRAALPVATP